nr:zinc ribbon domain-containing protein [Candidatus Sigynarchaeota archaeon]
MQTKHGEGLKDTSDEKPPIILADWSETEGPIIIKALFPTGIGGTNNTPEILITRCYISAESIFAKEKFAKINFNLPMVAFKKLGVVLFDTVSDPTVRGALRPFLLVIFVPLNTRYAITDAVVKLAEPFVLSYKNGMVPNLEALQNEVQQAIEKGGDATEAEGANAELKKEFSSLVKEHFARMAGKGLTLRVFLCPDCGFKVYPDEIACPKCRFIIRTFCTKCNAMIERNLRHCPHCGTNNQKYDPSVKLVIHEEEDELEVLKQTGIGQAVKDKKIAHVLGIDVEKEFDASNQDLEKEIEELKKKLDDQQKKTTKARLFETFTRDYTGYKVGDKDITARSLESTFQDPAVDEVDLLIKSMAVLPPEERAKIKPDKILLYWDCEAFLHASGRILVGMGTNPQNASGIPGTLFLTETALVFVTYQEEFASAANLFAYFDASLQFLGDCNKFSPEIGKNSMWFKNHGLAQKKLPLEPAFFVNFSWSTDDERGTWDNQALVLKSTIQRQQLFAGKDFLPAGKYFFFVGKPATDNSIKNILAGLQVFYPGIIKIMKEKYPMLF